MIRNTLELKQQQKLSPQQIQTIKLIELPVQELEQRVRAELESNPVLDDESLQDEDPETANVSLDAPKKDGEIPAYRTTVSNWGKDPRPEYNTFSEQESFSQSLLRQLGYRNLSPRKYEIGAFIIGSLDDDGYLRRSVDALVDDLSFRANIETDEAEVEELLGVIQQFDPVGVGARDLRECLLLQLRALKPSPSVENAVRILEECFNDFTSKHFDKIMSRLGIDEEQFKDAFNRIKKLNPSPGGPAGDAVSDRAQQIVPDFILEERDGVLTFSMPRFNVPELRVNKQYADLLATARGATDRERREAASFVKQKLDSAKWFIEALKQRQNTLSKTMGAILDYQREYFADGDESHLRPMVLKDIAEITGFDISTISRVVNSKYIETPFGIFPLKYFFSEGMENSEGEEVSTRELKKALRECIDAEDKRKPLTDEQLVVELGKRGYKVARRTIAKYRGQLGIPLARWRKELV
ncbi:MAG: RNA polymerase factor sigma-54 [Bacteroidales bacterium]|nr:RNA polymerase factor sigma-54 [Bacteroidales bacterium]